MTMFTYGQIERLLIDLLAVDPAKRIALKGRLKHFARAGYPLQGSRSPGPRPAYSLEDAMGLVFAFELLRLRVPPQAAVQTMRASAAQFRRMVVLSWNSRVDRSDAPGKPPERSEAGPYMARPYRGIADLPLPGDGPFRAVLDADGVEDLRRSDFGPGAPDVLRIADRTLLRSWLNGEQSPPSTSMHIVDFEAVLARAADYMMRNGLIGFEDLHRAVHLIGDAARLDASPSLRTSPGGSPDQDMGRTG